MQKYPWALKITSILERSWAGASWLRASMMLSLHPRLKGGTQRREARAAIEDAGKGVSEPAGGLTGRLIHVRQNDVARTRLRKGGAHADT